MFTKKDKMKIIAILAVANLGFAFYLSAQVPTGGKCAQVDFELDCLDQYGHLESDTSISAFVPSRRGKPYYALQATPALTQKSFGTAEILSSANESGLTLSFWFKSLGNSGCKIMRMKYFAEKREAAMVIKTDDSAHIVVNLIDKKSVKPLGGVVGKNKIKKGRWNHVAIELIPENKVAIFLNGQPDTVSFFKLPFTSWRLDSLLLGELNRLDTLAFDDLRIYARTLSLPLVKQLYEEYKVPNVVMVDLNTPDSANSFCTIYANVTPDGEEILFSNPKFNKMHGYQFRLINRRMESVEEFFFTSTDYFFPRKRIGEDSLVFIQVLDPNGFLVQVYRMELNF